MSEAAPNAKPKITVHPAAAIFPMMSDEELKGMAESISKNGLREKIHAIISVEESATNWEVLDGRNRLEALRRYLKVSDVDLIANYMTPVTLSGAYTPEEYVMMANIERRNLTQPQRRELAGKLALMLEERQKDLPKGEQIDTLAKAAEQTGVSRRTAATAKADAKEMATKKPEQVSGGESKPSKPKEVKYIPLKPKNVLGMTENLYKTVTHEQKVEKGGKKITELYLTDWTVDEIRSVAAVNDAIKTFLDKYIVERVEVDRKKLEAELERMNSATS